MSTKKHFYRTNHQIRVSTVRLIDEAGAQLGIKPLSECLALARSRGLDLVEVAPQANPPVCKIENFKRFLYELEKKEKEARKHHKTGLLKEIRLTPRIAAHDLEYKIKHIEEFLKGHDKVRLTVMFRGREMAHRDLGMEVLKTVYQKLEDVAEVERAPQMEGRRLMLTLVPKKHTGRPASPVSAPAPVLNIQKDAKA